ncbi:hypothetical protein XU18_4789 [Perkinsela sp. CCAP 1560/4]|nr:hypothetical protein XU18_4789 [Perkinsela sp. CCAP 1560/4]|eukprot:KNH03900.1 hypothetical protein XU18_4789 [Perkinsela sp. CCAP 1560/4]
MFQGSRRTLQSSTDALWEALRTREKSVAHERSMLQSHEWETRRLLLGEEIAKREVMLTKYLRNKFIYAAEGAGRLDMFLKDAQEMRMEHHNVAKDDSAQSCCTNDCQSELVVLQACWGELMVMAANTHAERTLSAAVADLEYSESDERNTLEIAYSKLFAEMHSACMSRVSNIMLEAPQNASKPRKPGHVHPCRPSE